MTSPRTQDASDRLQESCERDLRSTMARYSGLFPSEAFDDKLPVKVAMAIIGQSPHSAPEQVAPEARASLWVFPVDYQIDTLASSRAQVHDLRRRCLDVADGAAPDPGDAVAVFLGELRDDLAEYPAFAVRRPVWRRHLAAMLDAMVREWEWRTARAAAGEAAAQLPPTFAQYQDNADNFGSTWVNVIHWITHNTPDVEACHDELVAVSQRVQLVLRLFNDVATARREEASGDLNALRLVSRDTVERRISELLDQCQTLIESVSARSPDSADYLRRQVSFSARFYGGGNDYWRQ
ncbi:terpene synthase family protein [Actinomadura geliboluensis]|uniref:terpene synthase family protein n=1 Tax=Actinomadura geliboluensis TaxID=882440 RepID=UPI003713C1F8